MAYNPNNPNGQATSANSAPVVISTDQTSSIPAPRNSAGIITTPAQQKLFRCSFAKTLSGADNEFFETLEIGDGQSINQASGNLLITSGITANSETILRSTEKFVGNTISRIQVTLSQRIANQQFFVELVDVIGDNLVANMTSATALQVTIPSNPFTAENIGQSMYVGNIQGAGLTGVPGRYTISAVSGNNVTFTVSGFSIANGTVSLFGWNYYHTIYDGTNPAVYKYDGQLKGWNSGDFSIANANTTVAPGHIIIMGNEDGNAWITDQIPTSGSGNFNSVVKAQRFLNLPDEEADLYLQIRCVNGSTAPVSTTTMTVGMVSVENYATTPTSSYNVKPQGAANSMPVNVLTIPNNASTSALQTTGNLSLASIVTNTNKSGAAAASASLPVVQSSETASGNITTQNLVPTGTATAGSSVAISVIGSATVTIGVLGTYTGALSIQATADGTTWFTLTYNALLNAVNGGATNSIASATTGIFTIHCAAWSAMRVTALAAVTGTANITLKAVNSTSIAAINNALPVGTNSIGNIGTIGTISAAMLSAPINNPDVLSAAITTTTTTAAFTLSGISYSINIPVTAVTGTLPTMDVDLQESDDTGTNWFTVYSFPRITANGMYRSPVLPVRGNRIRYVQTVGGTTPSFTRTINRFAISLSPTNAIAQLIDRSIVLTTLNSVTPSLNTQGSDNLQLVINLGTATTPPALQLEGSEDNGTTWYAIGTPLTGVASSTVQFTLATTMNAQLVRARVSTIGVTVVVGYVLIKGF